MSIGGGYGESESRTQQSSETNPWAPTQPLLRDLISRLSTMSTTPSDGRTEGAMDDLIGTLRTSGPATTDTTRTVAQDLISTPDRTGAITDAYGDLTRRLSPVADGTNTNVANNTQLQALLTQVGDEAQNRTNATFAAAGRDLSPDNSMAVARGVAQAQTPLLLDQFNRETARTDAAARDLSTVGIDGASRSTSMDVARGGLLRGGAELNTSASQSEADALSRILELEGGRERLPYDRMGWLTQLLYPMAGFGGQSTGTSDTEGSRWGLQGSARLY